VATGTQTQESQSGALVIAVFGALLAVLIGGVGVAYGVRGLNADGDVGPGGAAAPPVAVNLSEFAISPSPIPAGVDATIDLVNIGAVAHNLVVDGHHQITSPDVAPGKTAPLSLAGLAEGEYTVYCNIAGHRAAGMEGQLTIAAGAATGTATATSVMDPTMNHDSTAIDPFSLTDEQKRARADNMDEAMDARNLQFPAKTEGTGGELLEPRLEGGVKVYDLTAEVVKWEVEPGKFVNAWTYNGQVPGPKMHIDPGDTIRINLTNNLPESTALHFHGISDIPSAMDGVPPITQHPIKPGETFTYEFTPQRPAVAMYHSHHNAQVQVPSGMAGELLVGQVPVPAGIPEPVWRDTMNLYDAGTIGYALNGKSFPATVPYTAKMGDWIQMTYMNEGLQIHPMHLHGPRQLVTAIDGEPLTTPYWEDTVNVAPGQRITVLVQADNPGAWAWHCHILNHAEGPDGMFGMVTALIISEA
jgi:uncharacterized cupredoxin-like copper-binding protein